MFLIREISWKKMAAEIENDFPALQRWQILKECTNKYICRAAQDRHEKTRVAAQLAGGKFI